MLFTATARSDHAPKRASETDFGFLDRCAWPAAGRVRAVVEACLNNYPQNGRSELVSRLQSGDSRHFASASFEIFLHEYLRRLGFALTPHPELPNGSTTRPDFLVDCGDDQQLYLEAVCATDDDGRDAAAEARKAVALQTLDDACHPDFIVAVDSLGDPVTQPSGRRLANEVVRWLNSLDADRVVQETANNYDAMPEYFWQHEAWQVRILAIPLKPEARGRPRRLIGKRGFGMRRIDGWSPIRDAIEYKGSRYGELDLPLVVAVNVHTFNLSRIDEAQALFGQERFLFSAGANLAEPGFERAPNGAWHGLTGPRGKRCSGAWLFDNVSPYTIARRSNTLYLNPCATWPVPRCFLRMPHAIVVSDRIQHATGAALREVFGLDENWPE